MTSLAFSSARIRHPAVSTSDLSHSVFLVNVPFRDDLTIALQRLGFNVPSASGLGDNPAWRALRGGACVIACLSGARGREVLERLRALKAQSPGVAMVVLVAESDESSWRSASEITPACYPLGLPAEILARLVAAGVRAQAPALPRDSSPRNITLRLWDSLEVDGLRLRLGVAERNFLFTLARSADARVGKDEAIDCGPGRELDATSCRRRLGQRLGLELVDLLVPSERSEPYRLRSPQEIEALSAQRGLRSTRLRIVGRSEVRLVRMGSLNQRS